ncbi:Hsp20/alpha crystallin family protein [Aquimarina agarivorans]|uniref:Hsp20/alpha crystallin family protein n=1 Tax=Aquimarina agarivorans TaxID=980584 RepID=UPI000248FAE1|nr:Hsp20/alpha crystallin family protein [Aquimarina agarivorans]
MNNNRGLTKFNGVPSNAMTPFSEFGGLINEVFNNTFSPSFNEYYDTNLPKVNVEETDTEFKIALLAAGFEKDDFKVDITQNKLKISASFEKEEANEAEGKFVRREFTTSKFERVFNLPKIIQTDAISAKYTNGILNIILPKQEKKEIETTTVKID